MKRSDYTDYDQLPLFLNAEMTAKLLGISLVVPKEKFCRWVDRQTGGAR